MQKMFTCLMLAFCSFVTAQQIKTPSFFADAGVLPAKVMLVGTFHFAYPNLDQHKTDKKDQRNILSKQSQQELQQVLDVLRAYRPTRIYLVSS